ncbi:MAG: ATP-NAD kinase-like domain-containing protein [Benniella sp.]|nr:MAG: ATP-NAD kinase-like domain-containing protein [Benniella sp.]
MPERMNPVLSEKTQLPHASPAPSAVPATTLTDPPAVVATSPIKHTADLSNADMIDPFTTNIIHDTEDSRLVQIMASVADAGADAGAAADAVASARSSTSSISSRSASAPPPVSSMTGSKLSSSMDRPLAPRPSLNIPPQPPIGLHHALDGTIPTTPVSKSSQPTRLLPRSIESGVEDTLAKDPSQQHAPMSLQGSNGQRRIMTPTSRLAETAVGVREVSKKIGRARVKWETPKTVMIVTKPGDESLLKITRELSLWMIRSRGLTVYVEDKLKDLTKFRYPSFLKNTKQNYDYTHKLKFWTSDLCAQEAHLFDFAITLGGDGTVLFTSWLFQRIVPPILPFSAGSLGFLTPFPTADYQSILSTCLDHGVRVNLRMRFSCTIYRCLEHRTADTKRKGRRRKDKTRSAGPSEPVDESDDDDSDTRKGASLPTVLTTPTETFEILNDLVLDRGPSASLSLLELFGDEEHLTTVQADGIVISTPTGSTAYSLAAGGPLTHPEIPAILISPICPHTLSFRPMLLPDSMELRICVPFDSRSTAWASFDGRGRVELRRGDHIKVKASVYPFPTICSSTQSSDWFHSLSRCLRWNERGRQKGFRVVEHSRSRKSRQTSSATLSPPSGKRSVSGDSTNKNTLDPDEASGQSASGHGQSHGRNNSPHRAQIQGHGQDLYHSSGGSGTGNTKAKQRSNSGNHDYFNQSPQEETMLTCWGTDSSDSDYELEDQSDDDGSSDLDEKEDAADGDGEWEDGSSSDESDDDYCDNVKMTTTAAQGKTNKSNSDTPCVSRGTEPALSIPSTVAMPKC